MPLAQMQLDIYDLGAWWRSLNLNMTDNCRIYRSSITQANFSFFCLLQSQLRASEEFQNAIYGIGSGSFINDLANKGDAPSQVWYSGYLGALELLMYHSILGNRSKRCLIPIFWFTEVRFDGVDYSRQITHKYRSPQLHKRQVIPLASLWGFRTPRGFVLVPCPIL